MPRRPSLAGVVVGIRRQGLTFTRQTGELAFVAQLAET